MSVVSGFGWPIPVLSGFDRPISVASGFGWTSRVR